MLAYVGLSVWISMSLRCTSRCLTRVPVCAVSVLPRAKAKRESSVGYCQRLAVWRTISRNQKLYHWKHQSPCSFASLNACNLIYNTKKHISWRSHPTHSLPAKESQQGGQNRQGRAQKTSYFRVNASISRKR